MTQIVLNDKRFGMVWRINWALVIFTFLLVAIGAANLYSASAVRLEDGVTVDSYYSKQLLWVAVGVGCMIFCMLFDYRRLSTFSWPLLALSVVFLLLVLAVGSHGNGAKRWIDIGPLTVQPSEGVKISVLLVAARVLSKGREVLGWKELGMVLAIGIFPAFLVILQPDLGTALIILFILGGMILYRGLKASIVKLMLVLVLLSPILVVEVVIPNLHGYQRQRIMAFINPAEVSRDARWQGDQAKIAIGSGQAWGKGFMQGSQSKLRFLPEKHTDYAIAVFGEEWGFAGSVFLIGVFCFFLLSIYATARDAKDKFGSYLCVGVFFYFFWQILINAGMVLGMMPVVGVPLPFISYGGSATIVNFCLLGLVLNVSMRRFVFTAS